MGTSFAVAGSNLAVAYFEVKIFSSLPQIYPRDFDIFHTWLISFDIEPFYKLINELDPDNLNQLDPDNLNQLILLVTQNTMAAIHLTQRTIFRYRWQDA